MFSRLLEMIRRVLNRMFPYKTVEQAEKITTPLTADMKNAIDDWYNIYVDKAPWLNENVKSMNLGALISSEIARQVLLEFKWNVTSPKSNDDSETEEDTPDNERVIYLRNSTEKIKEKLNRQFEQGLASGSMIIKPYPRNGNIYFDLAMGWDVYPIAFDDDGNLSDVIFVDSYKDGEHIYTRLERHTLQDNSVKITNRCFVRSQKDGQDSNTLGEETALTDVQQWADLQSEITIEDAGGMLFGFFKAATANSVDVNGPMGISVYAKAVKTIQQADLQYSRMLWEYEGTELAVHVDVNALNEKTNGTNSNERDVAHLRDRLYRKIDLGHDDTYEVFSPAIRDSAYATGLNILLMRIEDQCGVSRGTVSDANAEARTATELKILKERTYNTIHSNQMALERCLKDTLRAVNVYADIYELSPSGEYDTSFEWDDSIITDTTQQLNERMELYSNKMISRVEMRMWYFGETRAQAQKAIQEIDESDRQTDVESLLEQGSDTNTFGNARNNGTEPQNPAKAEQGDNENGQE